MGGGLGELGEGRGVCRQFIVGKGGGGGGREGAFVGGRGGGPTVAGCCALGVLSRNTI